MKYELTPASTLAFCQSLNWLGEIAHQTAVSKGFWAARRAMEVAAAQAGLDGFARKCIDSQLRELIISELGEACEGDRKDLMDDKIPAFTAVEAELADVLIRLADYIKARNLRVPQAVIAKLAFNEGREQMHGGKAF